MFIEVVDDGCPILSRLCRVVEQVFFRERGEDGWLMDIRNDVWLLSGGREEEGDVSGLEWLRVAVDGMVTIEGSSILEERLGNEGLLHVGVCVGVIVTVIDDFLDRMLSDGGEGVIGAFERGVGVVEEERIGLDMRDLVIVVR